MYNIAGRQECIVSFVFQFHEYITFVWCVIWIKIKSLSLGLYKMNITLVKHENKMFCQFQRYWNGNKTRVRRQANTWTNAARHVGINVSEIGIEISKCSYEETHLKMSPAKWWPLCSGPKGIRTLVLTIKSDESLLEILDKRALKRF